MWIYFEFETIYFYVPMILRYTDFKKIEDTVASYIVTVYKLVLSPLVKSSRIFSCTIICCRDDIQPIRTSLHRA